MPPRFSVVIPTRERPGTLRHALATCLDQDFDDYEIVVCDNHSSPPTREVVDTCGSPRVRYVRSPEPLAMADNWELAVSQALGEFVLVLGDDDGLMPYALRELDRLIDTLQSLVIRWTAAFYTWPDIALPTEANYLRVPLGSDVRWMDARTVIRSVIRFETPYVALPMLYNSAIHQDLLAELRRRAGRLFGTTVPDVYSGFALGYLAGRYPSLEAPMSVAGSSGGSYGIAYMFRRGRSPLDRDYRDLNRQSGLPMHPQVPDLPSFPAVPVADSFLLAKQALFPQDDTLVADRKTIAAHCVWGLQVQDLPEWERAMDDIRATLDDDPALRGWFDEAFARYRPRLEPFRLRGPRLGYEGGALHLDTRRFGVEDVSGAVALCERILSYRASGIPLPHVPARPPAPLASDAPGSDRGALAALQWDELALFRLLERYVETRTMIDVGAHRGTTLAPFLEAGWQVYAFEPMAANRERLARRFGQHPALVLRPEAVSDSTGTKPFHLAVGRDGRLHEYYHSLERTAEDAHHRKGDTVDQATVSLDDLVAKGELPATIGFLKVDTEGHDLAVLRGAARLACEAIGVEFWRDGHPLGKSLSPAEAMLGLLADRGYDRYLVLCHRLDGSTALLDHTLEGIPDDAWGNIVAFHATRRTLYERVCEAMRWLGGLDVTAERNELHAQLAAKEATIQNQAAQLVAKETMLQDQAAQLVAKETVLQDQAAQLVAKETVLQNQAAQLASKERVIQDQAAAIQTKDAALQELSAGWFQRLRRRIRAGRA